MTQENEIMVVCPDCGGDGKETCNNPDHGFLSAVIRTVKGVNESACPCCGHDEDHKIYFYKDGKRQQRKCETCKGFGNIKMSEFESFCDSTGYDNQPIITTTT